MKATIEDLRNMVKKQVQEHLELTEGPFDDVAAAMKATSDKIAALRQSRRAATGAAAPVEPFGGGDDTTTSSNATESLTEFLSHYSENIRSNVFTSLLELVKKYGGTQEQAQRLEADLISATKSNPNIVSRPDLENMDKILNGPNGNNIWNSISPASSKTLEILLEIYNPDKNQLGQTAKDIYNDIYDKINSDNPAGPEQFGIVKRAFTAAAESIINILSKYVANRESLAGDLEDEIDAFEDALIRRNSSSSGPGPDAPQPATPEMSDEEFLAALDQINAAPINPNSIIPGETD